MQTDQRNIPGTMGTQHPDHAAVPFWHNHAFIGAGSEVTECFVSYSELGISEYMWDWEGKLVDEAVLDRLFIEHANYFQTHHLGKDRFLTFRLPNPKVETEYRLARAFIGMMNGSALARHMQYSHHPLFEVILPMTETAQDMINIQEAFTELASLTHPLLKFGETSFTHIELIPLFETIDTIANADSILRKYLTLHKQRFSFTPSYIRPFLARSDPALNSGIVPTVLSIKIALHRLHVLEKQQEIPLYPILGAAALPFRGGLTPSTVSEFIAEYQGIRTTTIQGGFKYDYPKENVIEAIKQIEQLLPKTQARQIGEATETMMRVCMQDFERFYQSTVESIAPVINEVSSSLPKRRDRVQHVGLFGYSRGVGKVKLPRAIGFCAALYSLGIPPEMIATGRGLLHAEKTGSLAVIEEQYTNLRHDMQRSGVYVNYDVLYQLAKKITGFSDIVEDIKALERYLGEELGPQTDDEREHKQCTDVIFSGLENGTIRTEDIEHAAVLRKSLG